MGPRDVFHSGLPIRRSSLRRRYREGRIPNVGIGEPLSPFCTPGIVSDQRQQPPRANLIQKISQVPGGGTAAAFCRDQNRDRA